MSVESRAEVLDLRLYFHLKSQTVFSAHSNCALIHLFLIVSEKIS